MLICVQFYDAYDVTIDAARKLAEYLNSIRPVSIITPEIRNHANAIASESLQEDEGLLAIAIAAPSLKLAVVQFRDVIELAPEVANNHTLLRAYWRELGLAWNHTEGAEFWGPPFRDCGALRGRWLWPYSVNFQANGIKWVESRSANSNFHKQFYRLRLCLLHHKISFFKLNCFLLFRCYAILLSLYTQNCRQHIHSCWW